MSWISKGFAIAGIICGGIGIHMLYEGTTATFATVSFSAGAGLIIIGLAFISVAFYSYVGPWLARNYLVLLGILIAIVLLGVYVALNYQPGGTAGTGGAGQTGGTADKYEILVQLILIIIGITAAVGYGIYRWIWQNIRERVERIADEDRNVARAEVQSSLGYVWYQSYDAEKGRQNQMKKLHDQLNDIKIKRKVGVEHKEEADSSKPADYLEFAIGRAERALEYANKLNETDHEELICRCKNNLAYYLAERRDSRDKERALELARHAYEVAKEKRASGYTEPYSWKETYAWVLWHFADDDQNAKEKARQIINELKKRTNIPFNWRKEIGKEWAPLLDK